MAAPHGNLEPSRLENLVAALAHYRGDLLLGWYDAWVLTERERLRLLHGALWTNAEANAKLVAIHGMGGVGKSTIAREYALRMAQAFHRWRVEKTGSVEQEMGGEEKVN